MYATIRRYDGIDKVRSDEITRKFSESLLPSISKLPGFAGYFVIDAGEAAIAEVGLFETPEQAHESTRLAASWVRQTDLASALPNTPMVTAGPLIVQGRPAAAPTNGARAHA
ncbi:MAG TPA: hypothetical protein VN770_06665 [Gaiellaceae bacterium]|nr:hypothetical protein [Gaiellaceae bacterium]